MLWTHKLQTCVDKRGPGNKCWTPKAPDLAGLAWLGLAGLAWLAWLGWLGWLGLACFLDPCLELMGSKFVFWTHVWSFWVQNLFSGPISGPMSGAYGSKACFPIWAQGPMGPMGPMISDMGPRPHGAQMADNLGPRPHGAHGAHVFRYGPEAPWGPWGLCFSIFFKI